MRARRMIFTTIIGTLIWLILQGLSGTNLFYAIKHNIGGGVFLIISCVMPSILLGIYSTRVLFRDWGSGHLTRDETSAAISRVLVGVTSSFWLTALVVVAAIVTVGTWIDPFSVLQMQFLPMTASAWLAAQAVDFFS